MEATACDMEILEILRRQRVALLNAQRLLRGEKISEQPTLF